MNQLSKNNIVTYFGDDCIGQIYIVINEEKIDIYAQPFDGKIFHLGYNRPQEYFTKLVYTIKDYERVVRLINEYEDAVLVEVGMADMSTNDTYYKYIYIRHKIFSFESPLIDFMINSYEASYMISEGGVTVFSKDEKLQYFNKDVVEDYLNVDKLLDDRRSLDETSSYDDDGYDLNKNSECCVEFDDSKILCDVSHIEDIPEEYKFESEAEVIYERKCFNELPVNITTTGCGYRCRAEKDIYDRYKTVLVEHQLDEKKCYRYTVIQSDVFEFDSEERINYIYITYYNDLVIPSFITDVGIYMLFGGLFYHSYEQAIGYGTDTESTPLRKYFCCEKSSGYINLPFDKYVNLNEYYKFPMHEKNKVNTIDRYPL